MTLTWEDLLDSAARDGAAIGRYCAARPDDVVIPCPEWRGRDLLAHLAAYARWVPRVLDGTATPPTDPPEPIDPHYPVDRWDADLNHLLVALRATDPQRPTPQVLGLPATAAFWARRTAHEFGVHRVDAATLDPRDPDPIPAALARDGIDEYFDAFVLPAMTAGLAPPLEMTLVVEISDLGVELRRDLPRPGAATVLHGTASDLLLAVWGRRSLLGHHVDGPVQPLEVWPRM